MKKRTLSEIQEILATADDFLGAVTIPILKEILFVDLGMNATFINRNVGDQRKLLDWFNATKKAYQMITNINETEENNANINPIKD
jgi:hypothetical protein